MDKVLSISELRECMTYLVISFADDLTATFGARFINSTDVVLGNLPVVFNANPFSNDGPSLDLDTYAKGFGIPYSEFKAIYQEFEFDRSIETLKVKGDGYQFELEFKKI